MKSLLCAAIFLTVIGSYNLFYYKYLTFKIFFMFTTLTTSFFLGCRMVYHIFKYGSIFYGTEVASIYFILFVASSLSCLLHYYLLALSSETKRYYKGLLPFEKTSWFFLIRSLKIFSYFIVPSYLLLSLLNVFRFDIFIRCCLVTILFQLFSYRLFSSKYNIITYIYDIAVVFLLMLASSYAQYYYESHILFLDKYRYKSYTEFTVYNSHYFIYVYAFAIFIGIRHRMFKSKFESKIIYIAVFMMLYSTIVRDGPYIDIFSGIPALKDMFSPVSITLNSASITTIIGSAIRSSIT